MGVNGDPTHRPGLLIVFEGIDGSGKSTQAARLAARLREAGHAVVETREPYDCEAGRRIREMARGPEPVAPEQELAWFAEQRREHVREVIAPALARGEVVVCDRYFLSTVAYQGARGLDADAILRESESEFPIPDLVLFIRVDVATGLHRAAARGGPAEPAFEEARFLERVSAQYGAIEREYLMEIDGSADPDTVATALSRALRDRLGIVL